MCEMQVYASFDVKGEISILMIYRVYIFFTLCA